MDLVLFSRPTTRATAAVHIAVLNSIRFRATPWLFCFRPPAGRAIFIYTGPPTYDTRTSAGDTERQAWGVREVHKRTQSATLRNLRLEKDTRGVQQINAKPSVVLFAGGGRPSTSAAQLVGPPLENYTTWEVPFSYETHLPNLHTQQRSNGVSQWG